MTLDDFNVKQHIRFHRKEACVIFKPAKVEFQKKLIEIVLEHFLSIGWIVSPERIYVHLNDTDYVILEIKIVEAHPEIKNYLSHASYSHSIHGIKNYIMIDPFKCNNFYECFELKSDANCRGYVHSQNFNL